MFRGVHAPSDGAARSGLKGGDWARVKAMGTAAAGSWPEASWFLVFQHRPCGSFEFKDVTQTDALLQ